MGVVEQIVNALKSTITNTLEGFAQLDYEYDVEKNSDRGHAKRYGVTAGNADFSQNKSMGFIWMEQSFQIILTNDVTNNDGDESQRAQVFYLSNEAYKVIGALNGKGLTSSPEYQILLVNGISFEQPEFLGDNSIIVLRLNINVQYKFRKNC